MKTLTILFTLSMFISFNCDTNIDKLPGGYSINYHTFDKKIIK